MKEIICIVCPKGCHLSIDENNGYSVSGNNCKRGETYAKSELVNPTRVLTSTVLIEGAIYPRLPVKTTNAIEKSKLFDVMKIINSLSVKAPISSGDILVKNIFESGADLVATRDMPLL